MTTNHAALVNSLETAALAPGDFYVAVMDRYFALCPDSRDLMAHTDELMRGRMMEQVVSLFLDAEVESLDVYFRFEIGNHEAYGAIPNMYERLFQACREITAERCGAGWNGETDQAWQSHISVMLALVKRYSSEPVLAAG